MDDASDYKRAPPGGAGLGLKKERMEAELSKLLLGGLRSDDG